MKRFSFNVADLARKLGRKSRPTLYHVLSGRFPCKAELAIEIEAATNGAVTRSMLRPDLWPPEPQPATSPDTQTPGPA